MGATAREEEPDSRDESAAERADRNLGELLQELRVAGVGVQVLFGFLLSLPFTNRFTKLGYGERDLYLATWCWPPSRPRCCWGRWPTTGWCSASGEKERLVRAASVMAIAGLATVGLAVSAAVLLVTGFVASGLPAVADHGPGRLHVRPAVVRVPAGPAPLIRPPRADQRSGSVQAAVASPVLA